jgi:hypothetical protein
MAGFTAKCEAYRSGDSAVFFVVRVHDFRFFLYFSYK